MTEITILIAVVAGLGSFLAPCILPMIPAFLAYISGTTIPNFREVMAQLIWPQVGSMYY